MSDEEDRPAVFAVPTPDGGSWLVTAAVLEALGDLFVVADPDRCLSCGMAHVQRPDPNSPKGISWADPTDGHPYRQAVAWTDEWSDRIRAIRARITEVGEAET